MQFTSKPIQNSSKRVSSFIDSSELLNIWVSGELYKSEFLLISSTLLVVKDENIYQNTSKMHITMDTELSSVYDEEQSADES